MALEPETLDIKVEQLIAGLNVEKQENALDIAETLIATYKASHSEHQDPEYIKLLEGYVLSELTQFVAINRSLINTGYVSDASPYTLHDKLSKEIGKATELNSQQIVDAYIISLAASRFFSDKIRSPNYSEDYFRMSDNFCVRMVRQYLRTGEPDKRLTPYLVRPVNPS